MDTHTLQLRTLHRSHICSDQTPTLLERGLMLGLMIACALSVLGVREACRQKFAGADPGTTALGLDEKQTGGLFICVYISFLLSRHILSFYLLRTFRFYMMKGKGGATGYLVVQQPTLLY